MDNTAKIEELFESIDEMTKGNSNLGNTEDEITFGNDRSEELSEESLDSGTLAERIEAMLSKYTEEKASIIELIGKTLERRHIKFSSDPDLPSLIEVKFAAGNKPYSLQIIPLNKKVMLKATLPIRVQCNSIAIVSIYIDEFNRGKAFAKLNLNSDTGELSMEYTYLLSKASDYNEKDFLIYLQSIIKPFQDAYTKLCHLAVGKVSADKKSYYKSLLEKSLAVMDDEEENEEEIIFGSEDMDAGELDRELLSMIKKRKKTESAKDKEEDNPFEFLESDGETPRIPTFEEFMRRKRRLEFLDDEETEHNSDDNESNLPFDLLEIHDGRLEGIVEEVDTNE